MPSLIFRKGLDLKAVVGPRLSADYHSPLIEQVKADGYRYRSGRLTVYLAREFGFCYGVDRAVNYAYQVRHRFPRATIYLTGEIIHNPHVNNKLRSQGVRFLTDPGESLDRLGPADIVVLPAFGVTVDELSRLEARGCTLVDTTCGSVLNVWKAVRRYAEDGFTSIIHGKVHHQETAATASQALRHPNGQFLIVLDREEAEAVCAFIRQGGDAPAFLSRFSQAASPGFDPDRHLERIGLGQPDDDAHVGIAGDRRDVQAGDGGPVRRGRPGGALPRVRDDLQRHGGPPGRRRRAPRETIRST